MKRSFLLSILLSVIITSGLHGEDLTTLDGKVYKGVKVSAETQDAIKLMHDGGISMVKKKNLPQAFLAQHELQAAPDSMADADEDTNKILLSKFVKSTPVFQTKDGRQYTSSDIRKVDPGGLTLFTSNGPVHLKFTDLPAKVKDAFDYDPIGSAKFESEQQASLKAVSAQRLRLSNAASQVDISATRVRLYLIQNLGRSWICVADILRNVDREVVIAKQGSSLDGPGDPTKVAAGRTIYETTKVQETAVIGHMEPFVLFGMPDYHRLQSDIQGRRTWTGTIYRFGKTSYQTEIKEKDDTGITTLSSYETDRSKAVKLVAENGVLAMYSTKGDPVQPTEDHGSFSGNGTGFAIGNNGYIATDAHVVKNAVEITVLIKDKKVTAKTVVMDETNDLAIIKVEGSPISALELLPAKNLQLGQDLFTIGFPAADIMGVNPKLTRGHLSALSGLHDNPTIIQTTTPIQPGNSGGPLCDGSGRVVGIMRSTSSIQRMVEKLGGALPQNINFATKSEFLIDLAKQVPELVLAIPGTGTSGMTAEKCVEQSDFLIFVRGNQ